MATEETPVSQESKFQEMLFKMMARRWNITGIVLVTFMLIVAGITGAIYMQTPIDGCGKLMYDSWGGKAALGWSRNKLRELGLLNENEAQPSVDSSYAGEPVSGSRVPPVFQDFADCPEATQNIALNLHNRSVAIKQAHYGPLNPNEPNEPYWEAKANQFGGDVESAKKALCGNCAFFDIKQKTLECIAEGIGGEDAWDSIEAGKLGYCEAFDFKCAAARTCDAWVTGGPITD